MLRPGIVYGPRSSWTGGLADEVLRGEAALVDGGQGICNAIYVDNVVHAIRLAASIAAGADGQAYLVGDAETVTWRDLYRPVADALGVDIDRVPTPPVLGRPLVGPVAGERMRSSPVASARRRRRVRAGLRLRTGRSAPRRSARSGRAPPAPAVTLETGLAAHVRVQAA